MPDAIVDPIDNSCPPATIPPASVTSSITYDGGNMSCLGITTGINLNAAFIAMDIVCQAQSALMSQYEQQINNNTTAISGINTVIAAYDTDSFDFAPGVVTLGCLTPASESLTDVLIALENAICALQAAGGGGEVTSGDLTALVGETQSDWVWTSVAGGTGDVSAVVGLVVTLDGDTATGNGTTDARLSGNTPALSPSLDNYIYHNVTTGALVKKTVPIGNPAPASTREEVVLYLFETNPTDVVSTTDLRSYNHTDSSKLDLSGFVWDIPDDTITSAMIAPLATVTLDYAADLSGAYTNRSLVDKEYVTTQIGLVNQSPFTQAGSDYYYDAGGAGVVGFGTASPDSAMTVHIDGSGGNALKITDTTQALGYVLTSDANGVATWQAPSGSYVRDEGVTILTGATGFDFVGAGVTAIASATYANTIEVTITGTLSSLPDLSDVESTMIAADGNVLYYEGSSARWDASSFMFVDEASSMLGLGLGAPAYTFHVAKTTVSEPIIAIYNTTALPSVGSESAMMTFNLNSDLGAGNEETYAFISGSVLDSNNASIDGQLRLGVTTNGSPTEYMTIYGDDGLGGQIGRVNIDSSLIIGVNSGEATAILEAVSTTQGFLAPRMNTIQKTAIVLPATSLVVFDTDINDLQMNAGTPAAPLWVGFSNIAGSDPSAIHDNVASEISAITEKVAPSVTDLAIIEDSDAANVKKRIQLGNLPLASISGATYSTVQEMQNTIHSSGRISGNTVTDNGDGTFDVAAGTGTIRATNSDVAELLLFDWAAATNVAIADGLTRYIGVEYNAGSPQIVVKATDTWDFNTDFPLAIVTREALVIHIHEFNHNVGNHSSLMNQRMYETAPFARDQRGGGLIIGETGTRNVTLTAGRIWDRFDLSIITAKDTSAADTFDAYYSDGVSGFTKIAAQTQINNTQYDDGSGVLQTLTNNRFTVRWLYIEADDQLVVLFGSGEYTSLALAEAEGTPSALPARISKRTSRSIC
jgi:hypothetical protein